MNNESQVCETKNEAQNALTVFAQMLLLSMALIAVQFAIIQIGGDSTMFSSGLTVHVPMI